MTLTGTASTWDYEWALQSVTYENTSDTPDATVRTISLTVNDGIVDSNTVTRDINVYSVNDPPEADPDTYTVSEDGLLTTGSPGLPPGVLANDNDPDGDPLVVSAVEWDPSAVGAEYDLWSGAKLTLNADGSFVYDPNGAFGSLADGDSTDDYFSYSVDDGSGYGVDAQVTITITGVNNLPIAGDDTFTIDEDQTLWDYVSGNDWDPDGDWLNYALATGPSNGTLNFDSYGWFDYTPNENFNGSDSFTYTADDGYGGSATATVNITVTSVNDEPEAVDDNASTDENTPINIDVLANDSDPDGDPLSVVEVDGSSPEAGTAITLMSGALLTPNMDGTFNYNPSDQFTWLAPGDTATDTFSYIVSDGNGGTGTAYVTITIDGVPEPEITLWVDDDGFSTNVELFDEMSTVDFGNTVTATPVTRTFTVDNTGTADLTLQLATTVLPPGFSFSAPPPSTPIAPGASTTFGVRLDATTEGYYSGNLQLANNDSDEDPFDIYLYGEVTPPVVTVHALTYAYEQDVVEGIFVIDRDGDTSSSLNVQFSVSGTASPGADYATLTGNAVIPAGESYVDVLVTPVDDAILEEDETVTLTLISDPSYLLGAESDDSVTIYDDDATIVQIEAIDPDASEPSLDPGEFLITIDEAQTDDLTVFYTVDGTAAAGFDYDPLPGSVELLAGTTSASIFVTPIDDVDTEGMEMVSVTLSSDWAYRLGDEISDEVEIVDTQVSIAATDPDVSEEGDPGELTITRTGDLTDSLVVNFSVLGTATAGGDFEDIGNSITIPSNESSVILPLTPMDDDYIEGTESIDVALVAGINYSIAAPIAATGFIIEIGNDPTQGPPTIVITEISGLRKPDPGDFTQQDVPRDGGRLFIDTHSEHNGGAINATKDSQFTKITVEFTLPDGADFNDYFVGFGLSDPDDPANHKEVDPNDQTAPNLAGDNVDWRPSNTWFHTADHALYDNEWNDVRDSGGFGMGHVKTAQFTPLPGPGNRYQTTVLLNYADEGGDNYQLFTFLFSDSSVPIPVAYDFSGIMTVWRKRNIDVYAMSHNGGGGNYYPSDDGSRANLVAALQTAYANVANPDHNAYIDFEVTDRNLALQYDDTISVVNTEWAQYLDDRIHGNNASHKDYTYDVIGVRDLPPAFAAATQKPHIGVSIWRIENRFDLLGINGNVVHELGHALLKHDTDTHNGHTDADWQIDCAFEQSIEGAIGLEICERHIVMLRKNITRAFPNHDKTKVVAPAESSRDSD